MKMSTFIMVAGTLVMGTFTEIASPMLAQSHTGAVVRLAELEIDPAQLDAYKAALREEIEMSVRIEPGVLTLYAVTVKDHPNEVRLFEMYSNPAAYRAHLQSEHFKKYKSTTGAMVKSLRLIETEPLALRAKQARE